MSEEFGLEEALDIAMEAELKAQAFYAQAAVEVQDPRGRDLLSRYEAQTMADVAPFRAGGEAAGTLLDELGDEAGILGKAIENEKIAGERYRVLADQTTDVKGRAMFQQLAREEQLHQRILEDEFYSLSNQGVWGWSGLYGE
jgi:rubrerythrin